MSYIGVPCSSLSPGNHYTGKLHRKSGENVRSSDCNTKDDHCKQQGSLYTGLTVAIQYKCNKLGILQLILNPQQIAKH